MERRKQEVLSARNLGCEECPQFNQVEGANICQALDKLNIPSYLKNMSKSYLTSRLLVYDTEDGPKECQIIGGVPRGSVLESPLWNIMYDDLIIIQLPPEAEMEAFADDAGLIITGKDLEEIRRIIGDCYEEEQRWMKSVGLELVDHKTDAPPEKLKRGGRRRYQKGWALFSNFTAH